MITIRVTAHAEGSWAKLTPNQGIPVYGSQPSVTPTFLIKPTDAVGADEYLLDCGYIEQGKQSTGAMRDRGVEHLTASGVVDVLFRSLIQGESSNGYHLCTPTGKPSISVADFVHWGNGSYRVERTVPLTRYYSTFDGFYRIQEQCRGVWYFEWSGDRGLLVSEIERGPNYKEGIANPPTAKTYSGGLVKLYRAGTTIRNCGGVTKNGTGYYSAGERASVMSSITGTGSGLVFENYLMTEWGNLDQVIDMVVTYVRSNISRAGRLVDQHPTDFGDLALECAQQLKFVDQNICSLVFDVNDWTHFHSMWKNFANERGWKAALAAYRKLIRGDGRPSDLITFFKPGSSAYLFGKYAVLPTVSDLRRLMKGASKFSMFLDRQRLHSRRITSLSTPGCSYSTHTAVLTAQCAAYPTWLTGEIQERIAWMKNWGMWPELTNLWDLLPYSFVLDWVIQFGDLFKQVDDFLLVKDYFPVDYVVCSEKWEVGVEATSMVPWATMVSGVVDFSYYVRWISRECPLPNIDPVSTESQLGDHLVEASALILVRQKKTS